MFLDMTSKRVLVTGASRGIGRAVVTAFADQGAEVHFTHRASRPESGTPEGASVHGHILDMQDTPALRDWFAEFADQYGTLDVLVNNVGGPIKRSLFEDGTLDLWRQSIELNLLSVVSTTQGVLPALRAAAGVTGDASIISISSISAFHGGGGDSTHYAATKAAVQTLTKGLSRELAPSHIRVNALVPSAVDTDFQRDFSSPERVQRIVDSTPLGRIGTVADVAGMVLVLADPQLAGYITGQSIILDGGRT